MADSTATFTIGCTYPDELEGTVTLPMLAVDVPFQAVFGGDVDVPDTTAAETVFDLDMGSIASVTALHVVNNTGQDMGVRFNSSVADEFQIPDASAITIPLSAKSAANPITALALVTTDIQSGAGKISYRVFGDPTA